MNKSAGLSPEIFYDEISGIYEQMIDFEKDIDFNILSFKSGKPKVFQLYTTRHYPHNKNIINNLLTDTGFKRIRFMKNFEGDKFIKINSKDMFVIAEK